MKINKNSSLVNPICRIFFIDAFKVSYGFPGSGPYHKVLSIGSNTWNELYFTPGSASLNEKQKEDEPGDVFEITFKLQVPGEDTSSNAALDAASPPQMVLVKYASGDFKILGDPENGCKLLRQKEEDSKKNTQELSFSCTLSHKAFWVDTAGGSSIPEGNLGQ